MRPVVVIPANTGIQRFLSRVATSLGSRFRGNDEPR